MFLCDTLCKFFIFLLHKDPQRTTERLREIILVLLWYGFPHNSKHGIENILGAWL